MNLKGLLSRRNVLLVTGWLKNTRSFTFGLDIEGRTNKYVFNVSIFALDVKCNGNDYKYFDSSDKESATLLQVVVFPRLQF